MSGFGNAYGINLPGIYGAAMKVKDWQQEQQARTALVKYAPDILSNDPAKQTDAFNSLVAADPKSAIQLEDFQAKRQKALEDLKEEHFQKAGQVFGAIASLPDNQIVPAAQQALAQAKADGADTSNIEPIIASGDPGKIRQAATLASRFAMTQAQQLSQSNADRTYQAGRSDHADTLKYQNRSLAIQQENANTNAAKATDTGADLGATAIDPNSGSILAQTGLSMPGFLVLTGQSSKLPRDKATRDAAFKEASAFANRTGTDVSTFGSQYEAYNNTLHSNIQRNNQMGILEGELQGTIANLKPLADQAGLGRLNIANVGNLFAGKQVNDPTVQQYRFQLKQLQSEVAGYLAAARGNIDQSGNVKTDNSDMADAAEVITNGLNSGGAAGLQSAVESTTQKAKTVLATAAHSANKQVWGLFGLGQNYDRLHPVPGVSQTPPPPTGNGWSIQRLP